MNRKALITGINGQGGIRKFMAKGNWGTCTEERKHNISNALKGREITIKHREKISEGN